MRTYSLSSDGWAESRQPIARLLSPRVAIAFPVMDGLKEIQRCMHYSEPYCRNRLSSDGWAERGAPLTLRGEFELSQSPSQQWTG